MHYPPQPEVIKVSPKKTAEEWEINRIAVETLGNKYPAG